MSIWELAFQHIDASGNRNEGSSWATTPMVISTFSATDEALPSGYEG